MYVSGEHGERKDDPAHGRARRWGGRRVSTEEVPEKTEGINRRSPRKDGRYQQKKSQKNIPRRPHATFSPQSMIGFADGCGMF